MIGTAARRELVSWVAAGQTGMNRAATEWILIWILAVCLGICFLLPLSVTAYFLLQWRKMDRILDSFQAGDSCDGDQTTSVNLDIQETRESRVVSQLQRILTNTRFREEKAVREKDQIMELLSDLSHQLKTPLANIVMDTELLLDPMVYGDEERRREFLEHARSQAGKMQWLLASLLKASRLENGMIHFAVESAWIKETIARAVEAVYSQAAAKNIMLVVETFQDLCLIHNSKWTAEALANILENAIKYSPENSSVCVTVTCLDLYTKISILDEGIGISEKEYNLVFKRFYRGKGVEQQEGSGLGLYLAQLIAQQEKGYITVASKAGEGSCFSLFLLNANGEK